MIMWGRTLGTGTTMKLRGSRMESTQGIKVLEWITLEFRGWHL